MGTVSTAGADKARRLAVLSLAAGVFGSLILVIPFVGTFVGGVLAPPSLVLGALALRSTRPGDPWRKTAVAALAVGILASGFFLFWIASGLYSEMAR